jgi:hypothetical protein
MSVSTRFCSGTATAIAFAAVMALPTWAVAQNSVVIDNDDIGGVVNGPSGPEAGV